MPGSALLTSRGTNASEQILTARGVREIRQQHSHRGQRFQVEIYAMPPR